MKRKLKKAASKVGTTIKIKGYSRKVGKLPPRGARGKFSRRGRGSSGGGQTKLF